MIPHVICILCGTEHRELVDVCDVCADASVSTNEREGG